MRYLIHSASKGKITKRYANDPREATATARQLARTGSVSVIDQTMSAKEGIMMICGPAGKPTRSKGATWCRVVARRFKKHAR